jgi:hypothetical protein
VNEAWIIESGEYSSYHVLALCVSEEEAERVCAKINATNPNDECFYSKGHFVTADDVVMSVGVTVGYPWIENERRHAFDGPAQVLGEPAPQPVAFKQELPTEPNIWFKTRSADGRLVGAHMVRVYDVDADKAERIARDALAKARAEELGL